MHNWTILASPAKSKSYKEVTQKNNVVLWEVSLENAML